MFQVRTTWHPAPGVTPASTECATCGKTIWFRDSYSPGDEAICAECDTEVTGRPHKPSIPVTKQGFAQLQAELGPA
jgi:recombinational DNA repair protein (RecF pathway)